MPIPRTHVIAAHAVVYAAALAGALLAGQPVAWPATLLLGAVLIALSTIDAATLRLPDVLTLPLAAAGVLLAVPLGAAAVATRAVEAGLAFALLAGAGLLYRRLRGHDGLGLGDAKLLAAAAAWLGLASLPLVLLVGSGTALAAVAAARLAGRPVGRATPIPFGPFLAFAMWLVWLYAGLASPDAG